MSMFFGDPERKRREKQEKDSEQDYIRHKRAVDAKQAAPKRLLVVKSKSNLPNFGSTNPTVFFNFGSKRKKKNKIKK